MNLANNSKASTEINNISTIATQCPREGGESVYRARTLMYKINRNIKYNDNVYCNTIATRRGKNLIESETEYSMIPDRQNNVLKFISKNSNDDLLVVKIFDLQGKLITNSPFIRESNSHALVILIFKQYLSPQLCATTNCNLFWLMFASIDMINVIGQKV